MLTYSYREANKIIRKLFRVGKYDTIPYSTHKHCTREDITVLLNELGCEVGAEIGVELGRHAKRMLDGIKSLNKFILVDPWCAYDKRTEEKALSHYNNCLDRLSQDSDRIVYMKLKSMEAVEHIEDNSLDFVYIDGLHQFDFVMMDLIK